MGGTPQPDDADVEDARSTITDLAGTIHDRVVNVGKALRRTTAEEIAKELTRGDALVEAEQIDSLLPDFFRALDTLLAAGQIGPEQTKVDDLQRWMIMPQATSLVKILQDALRTEPTAGSPTPIINAESALYGVLARIDRYVRGIAQTVGQPIAEDGAPEIT